MPRDFVQRGKQRGRRGEGKAKEKRRRIDDELRERHATDGVDPREGKRQRTDDGYKRTSHGQDGEEWNNDLVLDNAPVPALTGANAEGVVEVSHNAPEQHGYFEQSGASYENGYAQQGDGSEPVFFGLLSDTEQAYFKNVDNLLEMDEFPSNSERSLFLDSVFTELRGKECKVACSQTASRILEKLLRANFRPKEKDAELDVARTARLKRFWQGFKGHMIHLVTHRFAGHVVETLWTTSAPIVTLELTGELPLAKGDTEEDSLSMEQLFLSVLDELEGNLGYLLTDPFGSHALRVLLLVLAGRSLADDSVKSKNSIRTRGQVFESAAMESRSVPSSFVSALERVSVAPTRGLESDALRNLAVHPIANPVLQLLLDIEFVRTGKKSAQDDASLFRRLVPSALEDNSSAAGSGYETNAAFIKALLYDPVGSRLLEIVVEKCPGKTFKTLWKEHLLPEIEGMLKNEVAGYVFIKILQRLGKDDLFEVLQSTIPKVEALVKQERFALLKVIVERCTVRGLDTTSAAEALCAEAVYGPAGQSFIERMLFLQNFDPDREETLDSKRIDQSRSHASGFVQALFSSTKPLSNLITESILALESSQLAKMAQHPSTTHLIQFLLTDPAGDTVFRKKFIQLLLPAVVGLALDVRGSHVLDALWTSTQDNAFLREKIATTLKENENTVRDNFYGRVVWRNWKMDMFIRKRADWKSLQKTETAPGEVSAPPRRGEVKEGGKSALKVQAFQSHKKEKPIDIARRRAQEKAQGGRGSGRFKPNSKTSGANMTQVKDRASRPQISV